MITSHSTPGCQQETAMEFSRLSRPCALFMVHRLVWYFKSHGLRETVWKTLKFVRLRLIGKARPGRVGPTPNSRPVSEVLGLQPGDWVEVKSEKEILATLDSTGRQRGLSFLSEMRKYCGQRFTVHKRLERIFLEESRQIRAMKNTVTLDGVMCQGEGIGCDRSCFFYWREAWLRRVPSDEPMP